MFEGKIYLMRMLDTAFKIANGSRYNQKDAELNSEYNDVSEEATKGICSKVIEDIEIVVVALEKLEKFCATLTSKANNFYSKRQREVVDFHFLQRQEDERQTSRKGAEFSQLFFLYEKIQLKNFTNKRKATDFIAIASQ